MLSPSLLYFWLFLPEDLAVVDVVVAHMLWMLYSVLLCKFYSFFFVAVASGMETPFPCASFEKKKKDDDESKTEGFKVLTGSFRSASWLGGCVQWIFLYGMGKFCSSLDTDGMLTSVNPPREVNNRMYGRLLYDMVRCGIKPFIEIFQTSVLLKA